VLKRLQRLSCAATRGRLWRTAEVDHRVPLFRVWREHRDPPWPLLLRFWGVPNLQRSTPNSGADGLENPINSARCCSFATGSSI